MNGNYHMEKSVKSRSSSVERDDSFEVLCFEDDSDTESDSFTEVTAEEINCLENRKKEDTFSLYNFPSRVLKYFSPIVADHTKELQTEEDWKRLMSWSSCSFIESKEKVESETSGKELQKTDNSICAYLASIELYSSTEESEPINNEVLLEENQREVDEESEISEIEDFPDVDREEMYFKARPHGLVKRKRYPRSVLKLKSLRNVVRVV